MRRLFRLPWRSPERIRDDVDAEIAFHLEMRTDELVSAHGMEPEEARARAEREFGDVREARRALGGEDAWLERRARWRSSVEGLVRDAGFAVRALRKRPAFSALAVLTVALGIGATTLVFTVVDGVLLRPLPYPDSERLVDVWQTNEAWMDSDNPLLRGFAERFPASYPVYEDWRSMVESFEAVGAYANDQPTITGGERPERVDAIRATPGVFQALGVQPQLGRVFSEAEEEVGGPALAVLSDGLWRRRFGADLDVIGRALTLEGGSHAIVGVMPSGFYFPEPGVELWLTLDDERRQSGRGSQGLATIARLRPDVSLIQARSELEAVTTRIAEAYPDTQAQLGARIASRLEEVVGGSRATLVVLFAATALVLLVACANVMNMLFARATMRGREIAVRATLGAGRASIARSMLAESVVLAAAGGVLGVLAAVLLVDPLVALLPEGVPRSHEIGVDRRVLAFALAATVGAAVFAGAVPALIAARTAGASALRATARTIGAGRGTNRVRSALVVAELAVAVVLLVAAGLLGRSLARLAAVEPGFEPSGVVVAELSLPQEDAAEMEAVRLLNERVRERVAELPGVERVAFAEHVPFFSGSSSGTVELETPEGESVTDDVAQSVVSDAYFEAVGVPVIGGRGFAPRDRGDAAPVAVVNRAFAERHWPDVDPIGRRLRDPPEQEWRTVVGVVGDVRSGSLATPATPRIYRPLAQADELDDGALLMVVRSADDPSAILAWLRTAVWDVAPAMAVPRVARLDESVGASIAEPRFRALLIGALALLAALLAVAGVYALVAFSVARRTAEMGVRLALGASPRRLMREVVASGLRLGGLGLLVGVPAALAGARVVRGFLFEVSAVDPVVLGAAAFVVAATAGLAAYLPARRAAGVDPTGALRAE